jgi:hypothetical protein
VSVGQGAHDGADRLTSAHAAAHSFRVSSTGVWVTCGDWRYPRPGRPRGS